MSLKIVKFSKCVIPFRFLKPGITYTNNFSALSSFFRSFFRHLEIIEISITKWTNDFYENDKSYYDNLRMSYSSSCNEFDIIANIHCNVKWRAIRNAESFLYILHGNMDQSLRPHDFFRYWRVWPISCSVQTEKYAKGNRIRQKVKTCNDVAVYFVQELRSLS